MFSTWGGKHQMVGKASLVLRILSNYPPEWPVPSWAADAKKKKWELTVCSCLLQFHLTARPEETFAMHAEISLFISILISVPHRHPTCILGGDDPWLISNQKHNNKALGLCYLHCFIIKCWIIVTLLCYVLKLETPQSLWAAAPALHNVWYQLPEGDFLFLSFLLYVVPTDPPTVLWSEIADWAEVLERSQKSLAIHYCKEEVGKVREFNEN